ncbi:hypothetical protein SAMN04489730_2187 [Amycolatopsis australiensis]|uniref:Uncharacterized protein n=1 Tax=Amycolatopsis australiensis TaxID=546364 RepID=A0A1K1QSP6_9PSEU|nr:hypothetical protein SAMN04489730_2187 [Amycolatopsis australiensis]
MGRPRPGPGVGAAWAGTGGWGGLGRDWGSRRPGPGNFGSGLRRAWFGNSAPAVLGRLGSGTQPRPRWPRYSAWSGSRAGAGDSALAASRFRCSGHGGDSTRLGARDSTLPHWVSRLQLARRLICCGVGWSRGARPTAGIPRLGLGTPPASRRPEWAHGRRPACMPGQVSRNPPWPARFSRLTRPTRPGQPGSAHRPGERTEPQSPAGAAGHPRLKPRRNPGLPASPASTSLPGPAGPPLATSPLPSPPRPAPTTPAESKSG